MPALIVKVERSSIADDIGLAPGDTLISIDGKEINDILDYHFWVRSEQLELSIEKADGKIWTVEIEKDYDEDLGLEFEDLLFDRIKSCQNRCVFCFIDQLPRHMRKTLYIKDDDYRHSFLFGNFITLSNLREEDWEKIITMRLSPLYISVHALQPQVRSMLMGNQRAGRIRQDLLRLSQAGIQVHTQIVLCPGLNDGQVLEETIEGLAELYPSVSSIGIVPVGLTGHRSSLPELRTLNELEALSLIELIHSYQKRFRTQLGYGLVYGADEIYLKAGQPLPDRQYYDDFPQVENGIGIGRLFLDDFAEEESNLPIEIEECEVYILTGQSALKIWEEIVSRLNRIQGLRLHLLPVRNVYFGGQVTVTGLLTGQDIIKALGQDYIGKTILIPEIIFKEGQDILLDDITLEDIKKASGAELKPVEVNASALIEAILGEKY
ncbi:MAG: DUF512 domain-containing protein [Syntrophomonadaceae bacterium]|jgi:putative radical SAM enzyme (TIGR03279 family)|nr:DUF512 domain-containing protein [Syntrophomonadaceae bacterium]